MIEIIEKNEGRASCRTKGAKRIFGLGGALLSSSPTRPLFIAAKISQKFTFRKLNCWALKHPTTQSTHLMAYLKRNHILKVEVNVSSHPQAPP